MLGWSLACDGSSVVIVCTTCGWQRATCCVRAWGGDIVLVIRPRVQCAGLNRLSSPGMFVRTPPHLRVARYYDHVSPTKVGREADRRCCPSPDQRTAPALPSACCAF